MLLFAPLACGGGSRTDRIVGDEGLFGADYSEAVDFARERCPDFARAAGVQSRDVGIAVSGTALSAAVPEESRPTIDQVTRRHGQPDSVSGDRHHYDDIALRVDATGAVIEIVVPCGA